MISGKTKPKKPSQQWQGETTLMESPAGLLMSEDGRWCMGKCSAYERSLAFFTDHQVMWSCFYKDITSLDIEDRPFAFGTKKALKIEYKQRVTSHESRATSTVWFVLVEHQKLEKIIRVRAFLRALSEEDICGVAGSVDNVSEQFLWYLWEKQHATIDELTALGILDDPEEILKKIKGVINPTANEMLGYPLFIFREERFDPATNRTFENCWHIFDPMSDL